MSGGRDGIRTHDPRVANAVLSQLSYSPTRAGQFDCITEGRPNSCFTVVNASMERAELLRKMQEDWDARARENARYSVATGREEWPDEEFFPSGEKAFDSD